MEEFTAGYIHWGATTQDIMDIASVLQMRNGLAIVERLIQRVIQTLRTMAARYRDTPMAGRTHLQHALPITFGYKCGVWLAGMQRHVERLEQIKERCLLVQFGGAAGTLASLGDDGVRVRKKLASILGLRDPVITWHVARDTVAEIVNFLALVGGTLGKIALDLMIMCSNELNEVRILSTLAQPCRMPYGMYISHTLPSRWLSHTFHTEAPPPLCPRNATLSRAK